jgi:hypothetical protein
MPTNTEGTQDMNTNMQGHNHGGKNHLLGMLGIGALVLVVLLGTGRSFQQALPYAAFLACPLMMAGMMFNTTTVHPKPGRTPPTSPPLSPRRPPPIPERPRVGVCVARLIHTASGCDGACRQTLRLPATFGI